MKKIVTFGELMLRLSPKGNMRLLQESEFRAVFGGAEANVAVSLSNFGEEVSFVSKLPKQAVGQAGIDSLRQFGIDTSFIARGGKRVGIYYMEKGADQRASLCIYDREGSAFQQSDISDYNWDSIFENADWFHFTGITPALGKNLVDICEYACQEAKRRNITISCDLNFRSKLWTSEEAKKAMTKLCTYVDVCIANEEDAKNVFGITMEHSDVTAGIIKKEDYEKVAQVLKEQFDFKLVAITLRTSHSATVNDWAAMIYDGKHSFFSKEYHIDHIVDRVGSGDSFGAGLIYALRKGWDSQTTVEFATAASALKHSIEGDYNRVSVDEVLKLTCGDGSGRVQR